LGKNIKPPELSWGTRGLEKAVEGAGSFRTMVGDKPEGRIWGINSQAGNVEVWGGGHQRVLTKKSTGETIKKN